MQRVGLPIHGAQRLLTSFLSQCNVLHPDMQRVHNKGHSCQVEKEQFRSPSALCMHTVYFQIILNFFTPHCYWIGKVLPIAFLSPWELTWSHLCEGRGGRKNKCNVQTSPFQCMIYYRRYSSPILDSSFNKPQSRMRNLLNPQSLIYWLKARVSLEIEKVGPLIRGE